MLPTHVHTQIHIILMGGMKVGGGGGGAYRELQSQNLGHNIPQNRLYIIFYPDVHYKN